MLMTIGGIDPRRMLLIRLAFSPFLFVAVAIAIASRDWRLILFVSIVAIWFGWDLFQDWSRAFPQRAEALPRLAGRLTGRRSHAQEVAAGLVASLPILAVVILAFGWANALFLSSVALGYGVAGTHLIWVIRREGWSGSKHQP
jgi:hypothetical protein